MGAAPISLSDGKLTLELLPAVGAAVATLRYEGRDVLRPAPAGTAYPFQTAAFALVPFANRIANGYFRVGEREVRIARNAPDQAHPLHGHGWRRPWQVDSMQRNRVALSYEHAPDDWPWRYAATQVLTLCADSLEVVLTVENRDATPMPAGLGWHPYFHKGKGSRLQAQVAGVWLTDEQLLPVRLAPGTQLADWDHGDELGRTELIDHCHSGWSGAAQILLAEERLRLALTASPALRWLHIYSPPRLDFFCVEPVSHMPDAVNRTAPPAVTGQRLLAQGERMEAWVKLSVVKSDN